MRAPVAMTQGANHRWSIDFVQDALDDGRRFRILQCRRQLHERVPHGARDIALRRQVVRELDWLCRMHGRPATIVPGNGTELTSHAVLDGSKRPASNGITSLPVSRCRTPSSNPSTVDCGTNASTSTSSARCRKRWDRRSLSDRLQHRQTPFEPRRPSAICVCKPTLFRRPNQSPT
jgi:putative transposase